MRGNSLHPFHKEARCVFYVYLTFFYECRIHYFPQAVCLQPLIMTATRDLNDQHNVAKQMAGRENYKHAK